jgi:alpha-galactosidase
MQVLPKWLVRCKGGRFAKTYAGHEGSLGREQRAHLSPSATMAPLIAGSEVAAMSDRVRSVLTYKEVIAIDSDALGMQGERIYADG